jgi:hypothetical protein
MSAKLERRRDFHEISAADALISGFSRAAW